MERQGKDKAQRQDRLPVAGKQEAGLGTRVGLETGLGRLGLLEQVRILHFVLSSVEAPDEV